MTSGVRGEGFSPFTISCVCPLFPPFVRGSYFGKNGVRYTNARYEYATRIRREGHRTSYNVTYISHQLRCY